LTDESGASLSCIIVLFGAQVPVKGGHLRENPLQSCKKPVVARLMPQELESQDRAGMMFEQVLEGFVGAQKGCDIALRGPAQDSVEDEVVKLTYPYQ
jgi:hypothetical protein